MHKLQRKQQGAVLAEFAIILPLFLVLVVGVIEMGSAFFVQNALNKAVREGARLKTYALDPWLVPGVTITDAQIRTQVRNVMNGLPPTYNRGTSMADSDITISTPTVGGLQHARVDATYSHQLFLGQLLNSVIGLFGASNLSTTIQLNAHATMRVQQS